MTVTAPSVPGSSPATRKSIAPWIKDDVQYYKHQVEGIRILARRTSFILADDMGLGKSLQALTVFAIDVIRGWADTAVVVCPVTLKENWADEVPKFSDGFLIQVLQGTPAERRKQLTAFSLIDHPRLLVVNYEQVSAHLDELNAMKFKVAIFDEAHYMKNPKSKRTKACLALEVERSFLLTGTPMLNHVNELWPLLHKVDPKSYPKYWPFVNRYCAFGGWKNKQIIGVKNKAELIERLQAVMLRRLKKDVLDLPEVQIIERRANLHPEQKKLYDEVAMDMQLTTSSSPDPMEIENALTKFLRLKQICGTTLPFTGEDHSSKLDLAVEDDLELIENGHKIVVFTQFRDVQRAYTQRMEAHGIKVYQLHGDVPKPNRIPIVRQWSATDEPSAICCMLQVASQGLNLVAARHASFLDELFVPGLNQQAIDRLHRIGQNETQPVQVRKYICRNTIENRVQQILRTKKHLFEDIVGGDQSDWKKKLVQAFMEKDDD